MVHSNFIVLDVETNGIPKKRISNRTEIPRHLKAYEGLHVIELAYLHPSSSTEYTSLIHHNDPSMIDVHFTTRFHGINNDMIQNTGNTAIHVLTHFYHFLVDHNIQTIVAHNVDFDVQFLISESIFYNLPELTHLLMNVCTVCTMKDARASTFMGSSKWPRLQEIFCKITHEKPKLMHRALQDCHSCHVVYNHLFGNT